MWVNKDYGDVSQLSSSTNIKELNSKLAKFLQKGLGLWSKFFDQLIE